ncbi:MAG: helix-turn-helix domain-containing protein [Pseudoxanthomonas sp.]
MEPRQSGETGSAGSGIGALLREARERGGLSLQDVGQKLKMQVRVLESLENERWEKLGAPVFVRGQLRSYARLLKVDVEPFLQQFQAQALQPTELVSHTHTPHYQRLLENLGRRSLYVAITLCFFAVPASWLIKQYSAGERPQAIAPLDLGAADPAATAPERIQPEPAAPITASLAPLPRAAAPALSLRMNGESWVHVIAPDGHTVEQGLVKAGEQRNYAAGQVGRVVIGNATAVEVQQAGSTVDTTPYQRANVARFAVSFDGSLSPSAD